jgi:hypothetical protein
MTFNPTQYFSDHPRIVVPRAVFERLALAALRHATPDQPLRRRQVAETALARYLDQAQAARAHGAPLAAPVLAVKATDPQIRIRAALRAALAAEAEQQSAELGREVAVSHLAVVACTAYLDALNVPQPEPPG